MNLDDARSLGEFLAVVVLGGFASWKANKAAKQTVATGNGFARFVKESLIRLEAGERRSQQADERIEKKIDDHIQSHADADVHREKK
jgi:hypothetical protein